MQPPDPRIPQPRYQPPPDLYRPQQEPGVYRSHAAPTPPPALYQPQPPMPSAYQQPGYPPPAYQPPLVRTETTSRTGLPTWMIVLYAVGGIPTCGALWIVGGIHWWMTQRSTQSTSTTYRA